MKRLILLFLLVAPFFAYGQISDAALTTQNNNTIRGRTFNSKSHADMLKAIIDSKINLTNGWLTTGNAGTVNGTNFIGTTDNIPFNIRVNNSTAGRIDIAGNNNTSYGLLTGNSLFVINTTAIGSQALTVNNGSHNTAVGQNAFVNNTSGTEGTAIGRRALAGNIISIRNTAVGADALLETTGERNTAIGFTAGGTNITGTFNTFVGHAALPNVSNLTNATAIGNGAVVTTSNYMQLGNSSVTHVVLGTSNTAKLVAGQLQITGGTIAAGNTIVSDASGNATWTTPGSGGTVTNVSSANANATVATPTTTPVITIVNSPAVGGITITGTPSVGQVPTATSASAATWQNASGGGVTNTAANNEIPKSNGTNIIPSGLFSATTGNIDLGTALAGSARTISAEGSSSVIAITLKNKGAGAAFNFETTTGNANIFPSGFATAMILNGVGTTPFIGLAYSTTNTGLLVQSYTASGSNVRISPAAIVGATMVLAGSDATGAGGSTYVRGGNGSTTIGNVGFHTENVANWQSMERGVYIGNRTTAPTTGLLDGVAVFAEDVGSNSELFITSESGAKVNISGLLQTVLLAGTTLTLSELHRNKIINCTSGSAVTITVPAGLQLGYNTIIMQDGAGIVTLDVAAVTIKGKTVTIGDGDTISLTLYKITNNFLGR